MLETTTAAAKRWGALAATEAVHVKSVLWDPLNSAGKCAVGFVAIVIVLAVIR